MSHPEVAEQALHPASDSAARGAEARTVLVPDAHSGNAAGFKGGRNDVVDGPHGVGPSWIGPHLVLCNRAFVVVPDAVPAVQRGRGNVIAPPAV